MANTLELGIIGNCTVAALVDAGAGIVWGCFPRLDGDGVFNALLNGDDAVDGRFALELVDQVHAQQEYLPNSAILRTVLSDRHGSLVEIVDFRASPCTNASTGRR